MGSHSTPKLRNAPDLKVRLISLAPQVGSSSKCFIGRNSMSYSNKLKDFHEVFDDSVGFTEVIVFGKLIWDGETGQPGCFG